MKGFETAPKSKQALNVGTRLESETSTQKSMFEA
jgi:hypothetical protein